VSDSDPDHGEVATIEEYISGKEKFPKDFELTIVMQFSKKAMCASSLQ
jgi:hypothetical protein